jgi:hypothetical protein
LEVAWGAAVPWDFPRRRPLRLPRPYRQTLLLHPRAVKAAPALSLAIAHLRPLGLCVGLLVCTSICRCLTELISRSRLGELTHLHMNRLGELAHLHMNRLVELARLTSCWIFDIIWRRLVIWFTIITKTEKFWLIISQKLKTKIILVKVFLQVFCHRTGKWRQISS